MLMITRAGTKHYGSDALPDNSDLWHLCMEMANSILVDTTSLKAIANFVTMEIWSRHFADYLYHSRLLLIFWWMKKMSCVTFYRPISFARGLTS